MNYRNKALIYEVDDERLIIDEGFDDIIIKHDYVIIDTHTMGEEIINKLTDRYNDVNINEIYKEIDSTLDNIKEEIAENAIDYICRNYPEQYHE